jgi:hypothetical protein
MTAMCAFQPKLRLALRVLATNGFIRRMENRGYAVRQVRLSELEELYDVRLEVSRPVERRQYRGLIVWPNEKECTAILRYK